MLAYPEANQLLAIASGELSKGKKGAPIQAGSVHWNTGSSGSYYEKSLSGVAAGYWCHTFVSWCANKVGILDSLIPRTASTMAGAEWFKARGQWSSDYNAIQRGDIVYFKVGTRGNYVNHVGIVEATYQGKIQTIEGNTSSPAYPGSEDTGGCVARKSRTKDGPAKFIGFGRPAWTQAQVEIPDHAWYQPVEPGSPAVSLLLATDGYWGAKTTRRLQKEFGTTIDGVISGQVKGSWNQALESADWVNTGGSNLVRAMQRWLGITADGNIGPNTIRALQTRMGTTVDGTISKPSQMVARMQRRLNDGTFR